MNVFRVWYQTHVTVSLVRPYPKLQFIDKSYDMLHSLCPFQMRALEREAPMSLSAGSQSCYACSFLHIRPHSGRVWSWTCRAGRAYAYPSLFVLVWQSHRSWLGEDLVLPSTIHCNNLNSACNTDIDYGGIIRTFSTLLILEVVTSSNPLFNNHSHHNLYSIATSSFGHRKP